MEIKVIGEAKSNFTLAKVSLFLNCLFKYQLKVKKRKMVNTRNCMDLDLQ